MEEHEFFFAWVAPELPHKRISQDMMIIAESQAALERSLACVDLVVINGSKYESQIENSQDLVNYAWSWSAENEMCLLSKCCLETSHTDTPYDRALWGNRRKEEKIQSQIGVLILTSSLISRCAALAKVPNFFNLQISCLHSGKLVISL